MILVSFEVKHRRRIFRMGKGMKEKVKEWYMFLTIVMDKVYLLDGI